MGTGNICLKKILVMSFNDLFLPQFTKITFKKVISIPDDIGFYTFTNKEYKTIYTFLSSKIRRIWIHHYIGTHGIIILYEGNKLNNYISEIINILSNSNLNNIPILFVINKNIEKDFDYLENLRYNLYMKKILFNIIFINFDAHSNENEIFYGIDWLQDNISKILQINKK